MAKIPTIRPISDLRNRYTEIERIVECGDPVYLTKNGYGTMVVLSLASYATLTDDTELLLDEADYAAAVSSERLSHNDVFSRLRDRR